MMEGVTVKRVGCGGGWGVSSLWRTAVRSGTRVDESDRDWDGGGRGEGGDMMEGITAVRVGGGGGVDV